MCQQGIGDVVYDQAIKATIAEFCLEYDRLRCRSQSGELFYIKADDFAKKGYNKDRQRRCEPKNQLQTT